MEKRENAPLLEVKNLSVEYRTDAEVVKAVNGVNLSLDANEALGLVGETGAGKTTTCRAIIGLVQTPPGKVTSGEVYFEGKDLLKKKEREMRKIRGGDITMVFQDPMTSLNPSMTVGDQIMEVIRLHDKISRAEAVLRAKEMLEMVGIPGARYSEYPHQFSGGMKQRVVIAIALACNPKLLIADEPTTALDVTIQAQVLDLMKELKTKFNTSIVLITHDFGIVAEICEKVAVMYAGEIVESGRIDQIFNHRSHPYTVGLFGAIPSIDEDVERLETIPGMPANPADLPTGCKFHPRCKHCAEICKQEAPKEIMIEEGHMVRCHLFANREKEAAE